MTNPIIDEAIRRVLNSPGEQAELNPDAYARDVAEVAISLTQANWTPPPAPISRARKVWNEVMAEWTADSQFAILEKVLTPPPAIEDFLKAYRAKRVRDWEPMHLCVDSYTCSLDAIANFILGDDA